MPLRDRLERRAVEVLAGRRAELDRRLLPWEMNRLSYSDEYGTLYMSSDSKSGPAKGHLEFEAVMLIVYKAKRALCQQVALTMPPLDEKSERSTQEPSVTH